MTVSSAAAATTSPEMPQEHDEEQLRLMQEMCIRVNEQDQAIGAATKKQCHLMANINAGQALHRAFSVFLFDCDGRLLLQQRSAEKITFPSYWTNTCCSHPLAFESEMEERGQMGVRRAAVRKLDHELGVPVGSIKPEDFQFLTRILYQTASCDVWGEHEVDHILFYQCNRTDQLKIRPQPNEVSHVRWVTQPELRQLFADSKSSQGTELVQITPWFRMICETFLYKWWSALDAKHSSLTSTQEQQTIHLME